MSAEGHQSEGVDTKTMDDTGLEEEERSAVPLQRELQEPLSQGLVSRYSGQSLHDGIDN